MANAYVEGLLAAGDIGASFGQAVVDGIREYQAIQEDKRNKEQFQAVLDQIERESQLIDQDITPAEQAAAEARETIQTFPDEIDIQEEPTTEVNPETGKPITRTVMTTPRGNIPVDAIQHIGIQAARARAARQTAKLDLIMRAVAQNPDNPYINQYANNYMKMQRLRLEQNQNAIQTVTNELSILERQRAIEDRQRTRALSAGGGYKNVGQLNAVRSEYDLEPVPFDASPEQIAAATAELPADALQRLATQQQTQEEERAFQTTLSQAERARERGLTRTGMPLQTREPKPPTQFELETAGYGRRIGQGIQELQDIFGVGFDASGVGRTITSRLPNIVKSEQEQRYQQAQENIINAILRRESGAVISDEEFANARQQYFPQPGDSPETVNQKLRNLVGEFQSYQRMSGPSAWQRVAGDGSLQGAPAAPESTRPQLEDPVTVRHPDTGELRQIERSVAEEYGLEVIGEGSRAAEPEPVAPTYEAAVGEVQEVRAQEEAQEASAAAEEERQKEIQRLIDLIRAQKEALRSSARRGASRPARVAGRQSLRERKYNEGLERLEQYQSELARLVEEGAPEEMQENVEEALKRG